MTNIVPLGPSSSVPWAETTLADDNNSPMTLLTLPDAANSARVAAGQSAIFYALPKTPAVVQRANGDPVFSLTLLLSRQPKPTEDNIHPLIERSILGLDIKLGAPLSLLKKASLTNQPASRCVELSAESPVEQSIEQANTPAEHKQAEYQRLFMREATVDLVLKTATSEKVIASVKASGTEAQAALSIPLERTETLNVLSAIEGNTVPLYLRAIATYRAASAQPTESQYTVDDHNHSHFSYTQTVLSAQQQSVSLTAALDEIIVHSLDGARLGLSLFIW